MFFPQTECCRAQSIGTHTGSGFAIEHVTLTAELTTFEWNTSLVDRTLDRAKLSRKGSKCSAYVWHEGQLCFEQGRVTLRKRDTERRGCKKEKERGKKKRKRKRKKEQERRRRRRKERRRGR